MCGILCEICRTGYNIVKNDEQLLQSIRNRGPNHFKSMEIHVDDMVTITFYGAVLWMQGLQPIIQPVENEYGILLYNGDIFDETWDRDISDTQQIMERLSNANNTPEQLVKNINSFKGPFSLIYYSKKTQELYFTRDKLGRNSLLLHKDNHSLIISSVLGRKYECIEVPTSFIYIVNIRTNKIKLVSWSDTMEIVDEQDVDDWKRGIQLQQVLPDDQYMFDCSEQLHPVDKECVVEYIENVAKSTNCKVTIMKKLMENVIIKETVHEISNLLEKSVKIRLNRQPNKCKQCLLTPEAKCNHCTVGILFSGGLDCTIIALLAHKYLPKNQSIDLLNVAFKKDNNGTYDVPDRLTGRQSLQELRKLCPSREWVFREVNVPGDVLLKYQIMNIGDLVYPRKTILDESLGSALWFAAKAEDEDSISPCRVVLVGSGADELFGGYTRHRNAFKRGGLNGLSKELQLDWKRIAYRNLARDNRVICDHGRQPRMPYLDEDFTEFVLKLQPWLKCFPSETLNTGIGDKLMLRLVAFNLGLTTVATFPKRALQFGSRIANKKEKGSDISNTFKIID